MEKINIAELLKDCPIGMELYSPLCGDCKLYDVNDYNIRIEASNKDTLICLYHDGKYCANGEIMLFPKGKTTWEGFQRPFIDGDIVVCTNISCTFTAIFKSMRDGSSFYRYGVMYDNKFRCLVNDWSDFNDSCRLATEEEKQKLFDAIESHGYKWNPETKTLEKLVEPKFKVGNRVRNKNYKDYIYDIHDITDKGYRAKEINADSPIIILFGSQEDNYELVPNKFDINTLKPFDKVLVRSHNSDVWECDFFSSYNPKCSNRFHCIGAWYNICIPYIGNEHLRGTTDDCDEFYKNW